VALFQRKLLARGKKIQQAIIMLRISVAYFPRSARQAEQRILSFPVRIKRVGYIIPGLAEL